MHPVVKINILPYIYATKISCLLAAAWLTISTRYRVLNSVKYSSKSLQFGTDSTDYYYLDLCWFKGTVARDFRPLVIALNPSESLFCNLKLFYWNLIFDFLL
jgi:hypothetical protein